MQTRANHTIHRGPFSLRHVVLSGITGAVALLMFLVLLPASASAQDVNPSVVFTHLVNGTDANDAASGPIVNPGSSLAWTFIVTNDGDTPLANVEVISQFVAPDDITCDLPGFFSNTVDLLAVGQTATCTGTSSAVSSAFALVRAGAAVGAIPLDANGAEIDDLVTAEDFAFYGTTDYAGVVMTGSGNLTLETEVPSLPEFRTISNGNGAGLGVMPMLALATVLVAAAAAVATRRSGLTA